MKCLELGEIELKILSRCLYLRRIELNKALDKTGDADIKRELTDVRDNLDKLSKKLG